MYRGGLFCCAGGVSLLLGRPCYYYFILFFFVFFLLIFLFDLSLLLASRIELNRLKAMVICSDCEIYAAVFNENVNELIEGCC